MVSVKITVNCYSYDQLIIASYTNENLTLTYYTYANLNSNPKSCQLIITLNLTLTLNSLIYKAKKYLGLIVIIYKAKKYSGLIVNEK